MDDMHQWRSRCLTAWITYSFDFKEKNLSPAFVGLFNTLNPTPMKIVGLLRLHSDKKEQVLMFCIACPSM